MIRDERMSEAILGSAVMDTDLLEYINNLIGTLEIATVAP